MQNATVPKDVISTKCPATVFIQPKDMILAKKLRKHILDGYLLTVHYSVEGYVFVFAMTRPRTCRAKTRRYTIESTQSSCFDVKHVEIEWQWTILKHVISDKPITDEFEYRQEMQSVQYLDLIDSLTSTQIVEQINSYTRMGLCVRFFECVSRDNMKQKIWVVVHEPKL